MHEASARYRCTTRAISVHHGGGPPAKERVTRSPDAGRPWDPSYAVVDFHEPEAMQVLTDSTSVVMLFGIPLHRSIRPNKGDVPSNSALQPAACTRALA